MTLDKIYVAESLIKRPYGNEWSPTPYISRENTEYIRKDALLEWAKKELESAELTNFDEFSRGEVISWKRVLNKLNSM